MNMAFRPVPAIVQYDHDGIEVVTHRSGEFHSRHLKRSVADQHQWAQSGIGKLCPNPGRHGETHRSVVGRAKELGPVMNEQVGRAKQRIAHVRHHDGFLRQKGVYPLEQTLHGNLVLATHGPKGLQRLRSRYPRRSAPWQSGLQQSPHEVLETDVFKRVIANRKLCWRFEKDRQADNRLTNFQ